MPYEPVSKAKLDNLIQRTNINVVDSQMDNLVIATNLVNKAFSDNIPNGFRNASDEQIKKMLVNVISNLITTAVIDGGGFSKNG